MISKLVSIVVGILLFLFSSLNADFHIGVIGGTNFADLDAYVDGRSKKAEALAKICGGIMLEANISEYFGLRCESMYVPKGGNILDALRDIEDVEMEIECSYVELPLYFRTNHENPLNLYFLCGPVFSYLLNCETELVIEYPDPINESITFSGDLMDTTNRLDIGVGLGWGFKIPLEKFDIFTEMRYVRSLTNSRKNGDLVLNGNYQELELTETVTLDKEDNKYANQGLQLLLGVTFTL